MIKIQPDKNAPENTMFLLPPDVMLALRTAQEMNERHSRGEVSLATVETAREFAKQVIRRAAEEGRCAVIKNIGEPS